MAAALMAPLLDATQDDDSNIAALVVMQGLRARTWVNPVVCANLRALNWCQHALDGGEQIAILTMNDLMALPPI